MRLTCSIRKCFIIFAVDKKDVVRTELCLFIIFTIIYSSINKFFLQVCNYIFLLLHAFFIYTNQETMGKIIYKDLGRIDYPEALKVQTEAFEALLRAKASGEERVNTLFFCEHNPVLTLGKSGKEANLLVSEAYLKQLGVEYFHVNRGGDITYHGPGQITGYPVFDLDSWHLGLKQYIYLLEEVIIRFLALYGIEGERLEGATGVWIDLRKFALINPCGFTNKGVASLAGELGREQDFELAKARLSDLFLQQFT